MKKRLEIRRLAFAVFLVSSVFGCGGSGPACDISGTWDVEYHDEVWQMCTMTLVMDPNGDFTGTHDGDPVEGHLSGGTLNMTVHQSGGDMQVTASFMEHNVLVGTWSDGQGGSDEWCAYR